MSIALQGKSRIMRFDETVTLSRLCGTKYIDGKPLAVDVEKVQITGNIQPLTGRDLLLVPEGDRTKEQVWLYTECPLFLQDTVTRCGVKFQVAGVEQWGSYNKARLVRIDVGPDANSCAR